MARFGRDAAAEKGMPKSRVKRGAIFDRQGGRRRRRRLRWPYLQHISSNGQKRLSLALARRPTLRFVQTLSVASSVFPSLYRGENKGLQILLGYSQARPGRKVKQGQEEISRNHVPTFFLGSVHLTCSNVSTFQIYFHILL